MNMSKEQEELDEYLKTIEVLGSPIQISHELRPALDHFGDSRNWLERLWDKCRGHEVSEAEVLEYITADTRPVDFQPGTYLCWKPGFDSRKLGYHCNQPYLGAHSDKQIEKVSVVNLIETSADVVVAELEDERFEVIKPFRADIVRKPAGRVVSQYVYPWMIGNWYVLAKIEEGDSE